MTLTVSPSPPDFFADFSATLMSSSISRRIVLASCSPWGNSIGRPAGRSKSAGVWPLFDAQRLDDHECLSKRKIIGDRQVNDRPMPGRGKLRQPLRGTAGQLHGRLAARK